MTLVEALNECVADALEHGQFAQAQDICETYPGDIWPDLLWAVVANVADLESSMILLEEPVPRDLEGKFDLTDVPRVST